MIDLHCDTMMQLLDHPDSGDLYRNTWKIDIEKLQKAHSKIQDFALFINMDETNDPYGRYEEMHVICVYHKFITMESTYNMCSLIKM